MSMKGESDAMSVPAALEMIRATPPPRRSEFAKQIWDTRRAVHETLTLFEAYQRATARVRDRIRPHEGWNGMDRNVRGIPREAGKSSLPNTGIDSSRCSCNRLEN